jgi:hypothetical protein
MGDFHVCEVLEVGPQPDSGEVAVNLREVSGSWNEWKTPVGMGREVLATALVAVSTGSHVVVLLDDTTGKILRFNLRRRQ